MGSYLTRYLVRGKGISGKDLILFERYPNRERIADVIDDVVLITGDITEASELSAVIKQHGVDQVVSSRSNSGRTTRAQVVSYMK